MTKLKPQPFEGRLLQVACPTCYAPPGEWCWIVAGVRAGTFALRLHSARVDVLDREDGPVSESRRVIPRTFYHLIWCRVCTPETQQRQAIPFASAVARGKWAEEHRMGTGHDSWLVLDP